MSVPTPPVHMSASQPPLTRAPRRDNVPEYRFNANLSKEKLEDLIRQFEAAAKRRIDNSLATRLRKELLDGNPPAVSIATVKQLAKWCVGVEKVTVISKQNGGRKVIQGNKFLPCSSGSPFSEGC